MTRPIAALRSPALMNILANFSFWLQADYPAMSEVGRLYPQQPTFKPHVRFRAISVRSTPSNGRGW